VQTKANYIVMTEFDRRRLEALLELLRARSSVDASQLTELENELERAHVVEPQQIPGDVVTMNSEVLLLDLDSGERKNIKLVFPGSSAVGEGRISVLAPVGLALLGCREADELSLPAPGRTRRVRIERVVYQPEAAGNFTL
jgi:regulator of nucleoside diphosphate kinase